MRLGDTPQKDTRPLPSISAKDASPEPDQDVVRLDKPKLKDIR